MMFVRIVQLKCDPGNVDQLEKMADGANAAMTRAAGFKSATFFVDRASGDGGAISYWDTREAAEAFAAASAQPLFEAFGDILQGEPKSAIYEAYEPK